MDEDLIIKDRIAREKAAEDYVDDEWTSCPNDCAYCYDPDYGHPRPHPPQSRLKDKLSADRFVEQYLFK